MTNLDLSQNAKFGSEWSKLTNLGNNSYQVIVDSDRTVDLNQLHGNFDISKASDWVGGSVNGHTLTVLPGVTEVSYKYNTEKDYQLEVTLTVMMAEDASGEVILRLYNPGNGKHHYTNGIQEANALVAGGWKFEGVAWVAPWDGAPIYRVYNPGNDNHLYTMDTAERDRLVEGGWKYEGVLCNSAGTDGVPLYRVFNPYVTRNPHHYTDPLEECEFLKSNGWIVEGISWYGLSK